MANQQWRHTGCLPAKIMCQGAGSDTTESIGIPVRLLSGTDLHTGGIHDVAFTIIRSEANVDSLKCMKAVWLDPSSYTLVRV
ncbi:hypothetical protein N7527_005383 [Penicillium freii]|nr:hypothetical protein N7527_005383 [Penicillium freii]